MRCACGCGCRHSVPVEIRVCRQCAHVCRNPGADCIRINFQGGEVGLVDWCDLEKVQGRRFHLTNHGYIGTYINRERVYLHRIIMDNPPGFEIDHISGDKLDNRRSNLRLANKAQNRTNTPKRNGTASRFKGVAWNRRLGRWHAQLTSQGVHYSGGYFHSETLAALAYDAMARRLHGKYAGLNFPDEDPSRYLLAHGDLRRREYSSRLEKAHA